MITELIPTSKEHVEYIKKHIPLPDLYEQLAEEAAELSQAASKMARYLRGVNPTPKTEMEVRNNLVEEYTDVVNVACNILDIHPDWLVSDYKLYRWTKRLEQAEGNVYDIFPPKVPDELKDAESIYRPNV